MMCLSKHVVLITSLKHRASNRIQCDMITFKIIHLKLYINYLHN